MVEQAMVTAEPIIEYPDDRPFPSMLLLAFAKQIPLHLVVAHDSTTKDCIVVTVYIPDRNLWSDDYKTRRTQ